MTDYFKAMVCTGIAIGVLHRDADLPLILFSLAWLIAGIVYFIKDYRGLPEKDND